jgi:AraC family transcriptional regulator
MDKIFSGPGYTIYYRKADRISKLYEPGADYHLLIVEGAVSYSVGDTRSEARDGLILLGPMDQCKITGRNSELLQISISPSFIIDMAMRIEIGGTGKSLEFRINHVERDDRLKRIGQDLAHELTSERTGKDLLIRSLVDQVVLHLLRHYFQVRNSPNLEVSRVGLVDRRIRKAIELMHSHLSEDLPIEQLAQAAFLSPFHFSRLFRKLTGTSPHSYLAQLRTAEARRLLSESDLSITEIAMRVGYASSSHFSKAFRKSTGVTPTNYRNALLSK